MRCIFRDGYFIGVTNGFSMESDTTAIVHVRAVVVHEDVVALLRRLPQVEDQ
jgi:hypothetical protein